MYEVGLAVSFVAWHQFPDMEGPEGELHSHDYRLDVVVARNRLDARGMVCDLDILEEAMRKTVGVIDNQDLDIIRPSEVDAVTVEVLARWAHGELSGLVADQGVESLSVRVWESPVAFGGYKGPPSTSPS
jgi:6-pyruvoyltetrahydropterin/6-carboxytetrahydropterin synthase